MEEEPHRSHLSAFLAALLVCVIVAGLVIFQVWQWPNRYCAPSTSESHAVCIREWLSVLAAWFGVIGGGVAAVFVYQTIKPMRDQLVQARRQTSFTVGDEPPSLEIWTHKNIEVYRFRIVNWNRRIFLIARVEWTCAEKYNAEPLVVAKYVEDDENRTAFRDIDADGNLKQWFDMPGWENRSASPPVYTFHQPVPQSITFVAGNHPPATLKVTGYLLGRMREEITLHAEIQGLVPESHASPLSG